MEFIRKIVQEVAKLKDIRNFFNSQKEADIPAFVAYATDDVSESEVLIVGKLDKNINPSKKKKKKKSASPVSQKISKQRLEHML